MKKEREADEKRLNSLTQTKENLNKMIGMEGNIKELCARIVQDLDNCTNQDKKYAYAYLDLKVVATPESLIFFPGCFLFGLNTTNCTSPV